MEFINNCNCIFDTELLEKAINLECKNRNISPKEQYRIYNHRGYAGISLKHEKVSVHRIIGNYINGQKLPQGYHVHHKDRNKFNNFIENLEIKSSVNHCKEHNISQYANKKKLRQNGLKGSLAITRKDVTKKSVLALKNSGMNYNQIAEVLHCGYNTVWRRLHTKQQLIN